MTRDPPVPSRSRRNGMRRRKRCARFRPLPMPTQPQTQRATCAGLGRPQADGAPRAGRRHRARRHGLRRHRPCGRRGLLQYRDDRLSRRSSPIRPMPGRSSPSPFPISAMSAPTTRTSRPSISRRRRARAASCCIRAITQPSNYRATRHLDLLAEKPRRHRACRHRHPRAHRAHPREGHAERGDRARAVRPLRSRRAQARGQGLARPRRHGSGADGDDRRSASPGTRRRGAGAKATAGRTTPTSTSSPSITASSATSCASSPAMPAR